MFARIHQLILTPTVDRTRFEALREQWRAAICVQPGYRGYLIVTLGVRSQTTIILWETQAQADAWRTRPEHVRMLRELHHLVEDHFVTDGSLAAIDLPSIAGTVCS